MNKNLRFGKFASLVALTDEDTARRLMPEFKSFRVITGKVGTMDLKKVIASVETAAKREGIINDEVYRETHALYHAIVEAIQGVTRGDLAVGDIMRTVGLEFSIIAVNLMSKTAKVNGLRCASTGQLVRRFEEKNTRR